jgi:very-short-patch-repair endonuclease
MECDQRLTAVAEAQHGSASRAQAYECGFTRHSLACRARTGDLLLVTRNVVRLTGTPSTTKRDLMEAALDAGPRAAVSHEAAAWLWGIPGFFEGPIEVTRPRGPQRGGPRLAELHETRLWPASHRTIVDGIPVTSLCRTLFDLAGAPDLSGVRAEHAVEFALKHTPSTLESLRRMLPVMSARGRPGLNVMRDILAERPPGYVPAESGIELVVIKHLEDAGFRVRRQLNIGDDEAWLGRADVRIVDEPVLVEVDSAEHHSSKSDKERDARRDRAMERIGLVVVRIDEEVAFHMPWLIPIKVQDGIKRARQLFRQ